MKLASADAKAAMILHQQQIADAAAAAAAKSQASWSSWINWWNSQGINAVTGGPGPAPQPGTPGHGGHGATGYAEGGPVLRTGMALVHAGEFVIPARNYTPGGLGFGGGQPIIHVHVTVQSDTI